MSLGDVTKCDLSAGIAKIDREKLIKTLNCHYHYMLRLVQDISKKYEGNEAKCSCLGRELVIAAIETRRTAELLHTLKESVTRENIIWID